MKPRKETNINDAFTVDSIICIYYLDWEKARSKDPKDSAVKYNFWQLLYVDSGEYTCSMDGNLYTLHPGELILCEPQKVRKSISHKNAMVTIISFRCESESLDSMKNRIFPLSEDDRKLLSRAVTSGVEIFKTVPENNFYAGQQPKDGTADYELQKIKNSLELLFINIYEPYRKDLKSTPAPQNNVNYYDKKFLAIEKYMLANLDKQITVSDISEATGFSSSTIKRIFSSRTGGGALHYFLTLKIKEAKRLIREQDLSMTEISEKLGFSSVHYFSRIFKNITGKAPSSYAKSILK